MTSCGVSRAVFELIRVSSIPSLSWRSCLAGSLPMLLAAGAVQATPASNNASDQSEQSSQQLITQEQKQFEGHPSSEADKSFLTSLAASDHSQLHLSPSAASSNDSEAGLIHQVTGKDVVESRSSLPALDASAQLVSKSPVRRGLTAAASTDNSTLLVAQSTPLPPATGTPLPVPSNKAIPGSAAGSELIYQPPSANVPEYQSYGGAPGSPYGGIPVCPIGGSTPIYPPYGSAPYGAASGYPSYPAPSSAPGYPPYGGMPGYAPVGYAPAGGPASYPIGGSAPIYSPYGAPPYGAPPYGAPPSPYGVAPAGYNTAPVYPPYNTAPVYPPPYGGAPNYPVYPPYGGAPGYPTSGNAVGYPAYGTAPGPYGNPPGYQPYSTAPAYPPPNANAVGYPAYGTAPGPYGNPPGYQPYSTTPAYPLPNASSPNYQPYGGTPAYGAAPGPYGNPPGSQPTARTEPSIIPPTRKPLLNSTALSSPALQLQGVLLYQGDEFSARARASLAYPLTPRLLFGTTLDFTDGNAFSDSPTEGFNVNELYLASSFQGLPNLRFAIGQLDLTSYFDRNSFAKDGATHFFNTVFQTNPALSATGIASRPGLLVNWTLTDSVDAKAAIFSSSRNLGDFALDGFAGEVGVRFGNAIIRGTYATDRDSGSKDGFQEIFQIDRGNGRTGILRGDREESYGINAEVFIPELKMGIFGRYGRYTNTSIDETGYTYSLGVTFLDLFTPDDRLGLAYGRGLSNNALRRNVSNQDPDVLELFYDFRFLPNLRLGFTLQERNGFTETIAGFRLKTEFDVPFGKRVQ